MLLTISLSAAVVACSSGGGDSSATSIAVIAPGAATTAGRAEVGTVVPPAEPATSTTIAPPPGSTDVDTSDPAGAGATTDRPAPTASTAVSSTAEPTTTGAAAPSGPVLDAPEGEGFYDPPVPLPGDSPGDLIWARSLEALPDHVAGVMVLYRSKDLTGHAIPVSGVVLWPTDPAIRTGHVLTWAHGTTGLADVCAPSVSYDTGAPNGTANAIDFASRGFTFVATDYEGLGTEGVHPYLVGHSEARGVLDIVRAARRVPDAAVGADSPVVIFGHSQGGHAALMAAEIAPTYAPELDVVGTIAAAPAGELALVESATSGGGGGAGGFGLMMTAGFLDAYPHLSVDAVVNEEWRPLLDRVAETCTREAFALAATATGPRRNGTADPEWKRVLDDNSPGNLVPGAPVLMIHGDADGTVPPVLSEMIQTKYCALGAPSSRAVYPDADHGSVLEAASDDVNAWIADRIAAASAAPTTC